MNETQLKTLFRKNELANRAQRRAKLLRQLDNERTLLHEEIPEEDKAACDAAITELRKEHIQMERYIRPGYWKRLWLALLNR